MGLFVIMEKMDYQNYIKKFVLPNDFKAPDELTHEDLVARPLSRADLKADLDAVNSSIETIQKTRGGLWPEELLNEEFDFLDLAWHEREFRESSSFAYVVYVLNRSYIGCLYLYPMGHRTTITKDLLKYDADASWWVTTSAYEDGYYKKLYAAIQIWIKQFPFKDVYYSNKEIPSSTSA